LHLDVSVPIFMSDHTENVICEVQLRTVAMDVWASLEHDLRYKKNREIPDEISAEMLAEAEKIADIDRKMEEIHRKVLAL
ncbi:MAG: GTP pyrophosphokinase family protein, partial [Clostridia bacterium]|nr:GTP pyrophosphokinase family protein [Clostridia bacterium]